MSADGFGQRLREAREARGLSVRALADLVDLNKASIVNYAAGKHLPTLDTAERLALVLGVDPRWLAFGDA